MGGQDGAGQGLLAAGVLPQAKQEQLAALYQRPNPLWLRGQPDRELAKLWTLDARTISDPPSEETDPSVTRTSEAPLPGG